LDINLWSCHNGIRYIFAYDRVWHKIFLISIVIGLSLIAIWLYLDIRKEKNQKKGVYVNTTQACICLICDHKETKTCLQQKCACCLIMKGDDIIGHHTNNSL